MGSHSVTCHPAEVSFPPYYRHYCIIFRFGGVLTDTSRRCLAHAPISLSTRAWRSRLWRHWGGWREMPQTGTRVTSSLTVAIMLLRIRAAAEITGIILSPATCPVQWRRRECISVPCTALAIRCWQDRNERAAGVNKNKHTRIALNKTGNKLGLFQ